MGRSGSWFYLLLAVIPLLIFIACARPLFENRRITVGEGTVTIHDRFCKPKEMKITDLYQIVMKDDTVRSFRFRCGRKHVQISPMAYQDGDELSEAILERIKEKKIIVEVIGA
ncbi:MAG: hypothetical protein U9N34_09165 [Candidatus Cloacimonadota bacterium]|nr:hypothetical protein [Candidatus Cloacimonadota bacterium]